MSHIMTTLTSIRAAVHQARQSKSPNLLQAIHKEYYAYTPKSSAKPMPTFSSHDSSEEKIETIKTVLKSKEWQTQFRNLCDTMLPQFSKVKPEEWVGANFCFSLSQTMGTAFAVMGGDFKVVSKISLRQANIGVAVPGVDHAWLESGGVAVDPTIRQFLTVEHEETLKEKDLLVGTTFVGKVEDFKAVLNDIQDGLYSPDETFQEPFAVEQYRKVLAEQSVKNALLMNPFTRVALSSAEKKRVVEDLQDMSYLPWKNIL